MIKKMALWLSVGIFSTLAHNTLAQVTHNPAREVTASLIEGEDEAGNAVSLHWTAPYAGGDFTYIPNSATTITYHNVAATINEYFTEAICFPAATLTDMDGFKITQVKFHTPNVANTHDYYIIKIWLEDAESIEPGETPVYENPYVLMSGRNMDYTIELGDNAVDIGTNKDVWIGVSIKQTNGSATSLPRYTGTTTTAIYNSTIASYIKYHDGDTWAAAPNTRSIWPITATIEPGTPLTGYQIERNGTALSSAAALNPTTTTYTDILPKSDLYNYTVTALYDDESAAPAAADKTISFVSESGDVLKDVTAVKANGNQVTINWAFTPLDAYKDRTPAFNIYRNNTKLTTTPLEDVYQYVDPLTESGAYTYSVSFVSQLQNSESNKISAATPILFQKLIATAAVDAKPYDATDDAIGNTTITFQKDNADGAVVALTAPTDYTFTSRFDSPDVAEATVPINVSGTITLTGAAADTYWLTPESATFTQAAAITAKGLTIAGLTATESKPYDGTPEATITGTPTLTGVVLPTDAERVNLGLTTPTYAFDNANAGTGKTITTTTEFVLTGPAKGNYTLTQPTFTAAITAAPLNITGLTAKDKTYNGTLNGEGEGTPTSTDILDADQRDVTITGTPLYTFADANVSADPIAVTVSGLSLSGDKSANYNLQPIAGLTAKINPAPLTIKGLTAANKIYNGTTEATITETSLPELEGIISGDDVTLVSTAATYAFTDNANVGNGKPVSGSDFTLSGGKAGNYALTQPTGLFASITPRPLNISGLTADPKTYNGTNVGSGTLLAAATNDLLDADKTDVTINGELTYTFAQANASADALPVTVSGLSLSGDKSANYDLTYPTNLTAKINQAPLGIDGLTAQNKEFDKTTAATVTGTPVLSGTLYSQGATPDDVSLSGTPTYAFASSALGTGLTVNVTNNYTLTGSASGNYNLTAPALKANITPRLLDITGIKADNKPYDGTRDATISGTPALDPSRILPGDVVTLAAGSKPKGIFVSTPPNVADNIAVLVSGYSDLAGANRANYAINPPVLYASITPKTLTLSGSVKEKTYDGTTTATLAAAPTLTGIVAPDVVTLTGAGTAVATFADAKAGAAVPVTISGLSLDGAQKGNYTLDATLSAPIAPAPLTVTGLTANDKTYDGLTDATVSGTPELGGIIGDDKVALDSVKYAFADANVRWVDAVDEDEDEVDAVLAAAAETDPADPADPTDPADEAAKVVGKVDVILTAKLTGDDAGNYTPPAPKLSALITPAVLTITPDAEQAKLVGQLDPDTLLFTSKGWVLDDDDLLLTGALTREPGDTIGTYPILIGTLALDNTNYTLAFIDDVLFTILPGDGIDPVKVSGLKVYPNPVPQGGTLHIVSETPAALIRISSITGALMQQLPATGQVTDIPINLPAGSYLLSVDGKIAKFIVR